MLCRLFLPNISTRRYQYDFGHDRISSQHSRLLIFIILYIVCIQNSNPHSVAYTVNGLIFHPTSTNVIETSRLVNGVRRQIKEEQSIGRGAAGEDNDDKKDDNNPNNNDKDQQHSSYAQQQQRHPNYYYTNGNRVSSTTKSAYSYYDYNDDDSYYNRNSNNKNYNSRNRNHIYNNYTTKLSDVYWCLLIALGWTIWMIHSIASLRQQHYTTMMSLNDGTIDMNNPILHNNHNNMNNNIDTIQRLYQMNYKSLLIIRGHVLDILPNPILPTDTPIVSSVPTYTVVVDYVVERQQQQQQPLSPITTSSTTMKDDVTTLPTIMSDGDNNNNNNVITIPNEYIQIRKHFETIQTNIEIGFGTIELLVLPNDPMCSIIKYDYDTYIEQEQRIQHIIELEQYNRKQRRHRNNNQKKKRKQKQQQQTTLLQQQKQQSVYQKSNITPSSEHLVIDHSSEHFDPDSSTSVKKTNYTTSIRPNLEIDTTYNNNKTEQDDLKYQNVNGNNVDDDDDDDDIFGCDMCCSYCDCNYDQYQWKRLSLFFAILLVIASIIGTIHVVFRMDTKDRWLGWMTVCIGLVLLLPIAIWIHKVMILCHRWSESQPEKQGYIVHSSTMTGTITSYNNGDEPNSNNINNNNNTNTLPIHNNPNLPNMMTLADACMKPSCNDLMDDICDPNCSNHTFTTTTSYQPHTSKSNNNNNPTGFSYVVPEMTGCYFIHYPRKNHQHQHRHHDHRHTNKRSRKLQQLNERHETHRLHKTSNDNDNEEEDITDGSNIGIETQVSPTTMDNSIVISEVIMDNNNTNHHYHLSTPSLQNMKRNNSLSSSSVVSGAGGVSILSTSSVSSISSNDDPTMKQLSLWNSMIHVVNKMRSTDDADSN